MPQPGHFQLVLSACLVVNFDFLPSVFYSEEAVCLLHWLQKKTFFCGVVRFAIGLAGWVECSWFAVISVVCTVGLVIIHGLVVVGGSVSLTTVIITLIVVTGTIFVGVVSVSLFL